MGKRGNGEGGISRRKDGLYMARYTVQTATGAKRKAVYGKIRKEAAEKLKKLAPDHVQALYQRKLDSGLAPGTVRQVHSVLSRALDQAVKWGTVPRNVCKATTPPRAHSEEIKPLDTEQARRLLEEARGGRLEALYVIAVTAGLRIGELLGLRWQDVDLESAMLRVRRTKSTAKTGPRFTAPKNGKGRSI